MTHIAFRRDVTMFSLQLKQRFTIMEPNIKDGIVYFPNAVCEIPECSLFSFVKNNVEGFGVKTALIDGSKRLSFLDTLSLSGRFAEGFRLHGIRAGDCVLALIPNTADALVATWALTFSGVTVVFPNSQRTDNRIDGYVSLLDFFVLPCADVEALSPSNTREATAAIGYTSGSTGAPKGVVLTHYSYIASICTFRATEAVDDKDVTLIPRHLTLISSSRTALTFLCLGATTVIGQPGKPVDWLISAFKKHKVSFIIATPQLLHQLADCALRNHAVVPSLRKVVSIGYGLPASIRATVKRAFTLTWLGSCYGLTEACGVVAGFLDGQLASGILGYPGPLVQMKPPKSTVSAPSGGSRAHEVMQVMASEMYKRVGDLGYYDERGQFFLLERLKNLVKCGGTHVATAELEEALLACAGVVDAAVVGRPHEVYGESAVAVVVLKNCADATTKEARRLQEMIAARFPEHMHLHGGVIFLGQMPRTGSGKIDKQRLRKMCATTSAECKMDWPVLLFCTNETE
ncbi:luciferin 4-monooxygenase [Rhipicephalus microplus]|uniref:luciferin 4-monooxygenase n=1 Tax=Rhipicephalus microplus TaxID=6941 RepID=UPI003F6ABD54